MRIVRTESPQGRVYRIYRASEGFVAEVRHLIPFLVQSRIAVLFGGSEEEPGLVMTLGPLDPMADHAFNARLACPGRVGG